MKILEPYELSRDIKNHSNFPFWQSMLQEAARLINLNMLETIMDFGAGDGQFSMLIRENLPNAKIFNVEISEKLVKSNNYISENITSYHYKDFKKLPEFDVVFSQEVVYTQNSLSTHAKEIYEKLKYGGYYFFTIGCHIENPTWSARRRNIKSTEDYPVNDYSLEEIANIFYQQGFRVSLKNLPLIMPVKYIPNNPEFGDITAMLNSCENHKILFAMLKPHQRLPNKSLNS